MSKPRPSTSPPASAGPGGSTVGPGDGVRDAADVALEASGLAGRHSRSAIDTPAGLVATSPVDPAKERRLVESARTGDESAIEALYRTYYPVVYRYTLFRVGSATVAEDVTSQVFLGMVRHLPRFSWKGKPFVAWLYAIAQKQVAHHHRSSGRAARAVGLDQAEDLIADTAGPEATAQEREWRLRLAGALRMLPENQREVVLLRHVLSLSLAETAAAVDKTEGAIKQLQQRGLATLRDILGSKD